MSRVIATPAQAKVIADLDRVGNLEEHLSAVIPVEVQGNGLMGLDAKRFLEQSFTRTLSINQQEYQFDLSSLGIPNGNYAVVVSVDGENPLDITISASLEGMMITFFAHHTQGGMRVQGIPELIGYAGFGEPFGEPFGGDSVDINVTIILQKRS
jgi:hypothetical protein